MDQEGPIENYQEFFDDILDEHRRFVSITRLPQFWFIEDEITDQEFEWGKTRTNILIKNEDNKRPEESLGLLLVEMWLIFPEMVEPAVLDAVTGGDTEALIGKCDFSLHTFMEVKCSLTFSSPDKAANFHERWESGEVSAKLVESLCQRGYHGDITIRQFNSSVTKKTTT